MDKAPSYSLSSSSMLYFASQCCSTLSCAVDRLLHTILQFCMICISKLKQDGFVRMLVKTHSFTGIRLSQPFIFSRFLFARHSSSKLFLGGLSYDTNETVLKDAFEQHGEIIEAKVICHHVSGKSKGYGFVQFTSEIEATAALKEMDGQLLDGRTIRVHYAHKGRP